MATTTRTIIYDGLWKNNAALVQLLGLCPLLAVTNTAINGLGLGLATAAVLVASNVTVSLIRHWMRDEIRLPVFVLVIASFVTAAELAINAWFHELYVALGIFIPLIVTNCNIIGRAEAFAAHNSVGPSALDGLSVGLGFAAVLLVLGALREILGAGTLFVGADLMFGEAAGVLTLTIIEDYHGFLLAVLPPGAFFGLGFLVAGKNWLDQRRERRAAGTVAIAMG